MRRKLLLNLLIVMLVSSTFISGCGFKDIDKRFFIVGTGIDYSGDEEKPYRITIKLAVPSVSIDPGNSKSQVESINTASIAEGVRLLKAQVDKEIDFGHCNVFLIGEELAKRNIQETVYWMTRRRDVQNISAIGIGSPTAEEVISKQPPVERFPGNSLDLFFSKDGTESSFTYVELLTDLFRRINEKGLDPILPIVSIKDDSTYVINQIALLNKEKIVLTLDPRETQLFNQLSGHLTQTSLFGTFHSAPYVVGINDIHTTYAYGKQNQTLVNMKIKQAITFEEVPVHEAFNKSNEILNKLEKAYSDEIKQLLVKIQQTGVDPYGFGLRYRAIYDLADFEKNWPPIYKELQFDIKTKMSIRGSGLLK